MSEQSTSNDQVSFSSNKLSVRSDLFSLLEQGASLHKLEEVYGPTAVLNAVKIYTNLYPQSPIITNIVPYLLPRLRSSSELSTFLNKSELVVAIFDFLLQDPQDEKLIDPIMSTTLRDPVALSSGFVVDRSTALDENGYLRFEKCPWSRMQLLPKVYPHHVSRQKIKEYQLSHLDQCIEAAEIFMEEKQYGNAARVLRIAEATLQNDTVWENVRNANYTHRVGRLADIQRELKTKLYFNRIMSSNFRHSVSKALEECLIKVMECPVLGEWEECRIVAAKSLFNPHQII